MQSLDNLSCIIVNKYGGGMGIQGVEKAKLNKCCNYEDEERSILLVFSRHIASLFTQ